MLEMRQIFWPGMEQQLLQHLQSTKHSLIFTVFLGQSWQLYNALHAITWCWNELILQSMAMSISKNLSTKMLILMCLGCLCAGDLMLLRACFSLCECDTTYKRNLCPEGNPQSCCHAFSRRIPAPAKTSIKYQEVELHCYRHFSTATTNLCTDGFTKNSLVPWTVVKAVATARDILDLKLIAPLLLLQHVMNMNASTRCNVPVHIQPNDLRQEAKYISKHSVCAWPACVMMDSMPITSCWVLMSKICSLWARVLLCMHCSNSQSSYPGLIIWACQ